ncbi:MAG: carboxylating nicotinate-nucleotide diphosphorylase [Candidatus Omnitrophica bacterium]|nr:carboxylating nicotinate-nucleotide diphosphorylase [Candidatus Omnitrophota bacterium]MBU4590066.1 carboxylating nicotinate-nucleotide diphosphorylase [Candidatus Omnitrophota bacterium]
MKLVKEKVLPIIMSALAEDIGSGDITSAVVFEKDVIVMADVFAKEACVVAGLDVAKWVFNTLDERVIFRPLANDGDSVNKGKKIISLKGSARNILTCERTALNFLGKISGVATLTSRFVEKTKGSKARIYDTRKTTPGMRVLEKYAVRMGGGQNHRTGLWDQVLIKDNHLAMTSIKTAVVTAKNHHYKNIEVEVDDLKKFKEALDAGADIIMLDNMKIEDVRKAVRIRGRKKAALEVSGGVGLDNVARIARTGVDRISIGSLTHSAPSIDFSLEICK